MELQSTLLQDIVSRALAAPLYHIGILIALTLVGNVIYNLYFHPLAKFNGPWYFAISDIPNAILQLRGLSQYALAKGHDQHGDIVRIGPNALSFTNPKAWDALYGYRKGVAALPKDPEFYNPMLLGEETITRASDVDAIPIRRSMNAAFAPKNLLAQEPMLQEHIHRLTAQIDSESQKTGIKGVDLRKWFTMSMFDVNSHFGFGEDMGCVREGKYHEWVQFVLDFFFAATLLHQCHKFWPLAPILAHLMPASLRKAKDDHNEASLGRVRHRMQLDLDKPDFMYHFMRQAEKEDLPMHVIEAQASVVILAGSETSAVGLTSATFQILTHPDVYKKLCEEIRALFPTVADINLQDTLSRLPYLDAVLWEALRIHAPLANGFTRVVPAEQKDFMAYGHHIPPKTTVTINHYACNTSIRNFTDPLLYVPGRWLGDAKYANDQREVVQPFSVGPRNCPGKNFALNNMKLAMAHMIVTFDMELAEGMQKWDQGQKIYNGWLQPPLFVRLQRRV